MLRNVELCVSNVRLEYHKEKKIDAWNVVRIHFLKITIMEFSSRSTFNVCFANGITWNNIKTIIARYSSISLSMIDGDLKEGEKLKVNLKNIFQYP